MIPCGCGQCVACFFAGLVLGIPFVRYLWFKWKLWKDKEEMKAIKHCPICGAKVEKVTDNSYDCRICKARFYITVECSVNSEILNDG